VAVVDIISVDLELGAAAGSHWLDLEGAGQLGNVNVEGRLCLHGKDGVDLGQRRTLDLSLRLDFDLRSIVADGGLVAALGLLGSNLNGSGLLTSGLMTGIKTCLEQLSVNVQSRLITWSTVGIDGQDRLLLVDGLGSKGQRILSRELIVGLMVEREGLALEFERTGSSGLKWRDFHFRAESASVQVDVRFATA